ncbi:MAG: DNA-3-methyladenine glycosylase 2 family protein [Pseudomonadota bacterium]
MTARLIETHDDIAEGCAWLVQAEPRFVPVLEASGPLPLRRRSGGFGALLQIICGQQLSVASAAACWDRLRAAGADDPATLAAMTDETLRECGLSRPKLRYARALAEADLDYPALQTMPVDNALATLTALKGIGSWSAEIYLMFCVGSADVFAHGDLALQEAAKVLLDLSERPDEKAMREIAAAWSPWRGVAARALWAYYRVIKNREGITE